MTRTKTTVGKGNSLFYALLVSGFLVWQSISISYNKKEGWVVASQSVPLPILTACCTFVGVALGINIVGAVQAVAELATRNSIAISRLSAREGLPQKAESSTEVQEDDEHK